MSPPISPRRSRWLTPVSPGSRVTRLELFYDLIFVFAFINVTGLVSKDLSAVSVLSGVVVLSLLWFCWTGFASLGTLVRADHGIVPPLGFAIMAAAFVLAVAIPQAFVDQPDDLPGPAAFAAAYLVVRGLTVLSFLFVLSGSGRSRRQTALLALPALVAAALIGLAAVADRWVAPESVLGVRLALWSLAMLVEYSAGFLLPYSRWVVVSAGHWAERHGLIVLVALGEAVIALGLGPGRFERLALTGPVIAGAALGIILIAELWWLHFDTLAPSVEQAMHGTRGEARLPFARDVFTYLHLPVLLGIIGTALGLKLVLTTVAEPGAPSAASATITLYAGVTIFLLAGAAVTARVFRRVRWSNLVGGVVVLLLAVPVAYLPSLAALALLTAVCGVLAVSQRFTGGAARVRIKESVRQEEHAVEAAVSQWRGRHL